MTGEPISERNVSLGKPGTLSVEFAGNGGEENTKEYDLKPGSAIVIEGPDDFLMTYSVPEEAGDE